MMRALLLVALAGISLSACAATTPQQQSRTMASEARASTPSPRPVAAAAPVPDASRKAQSGAVSTAPRATSVEEREVDVWDALRSSFAMPQCPPEAISLARQETRNPALFESTMHDVLPLIDYIQRVAGEERVAGELALLPWVESHYRDIEPVGSRPAGMWQIVPVTGRSMHLAMGRTYDGRLDRVASTRAALRLMARYHRNWDDWRVATMAYNTGEYGMRRAIARHGMPPAHPAIPRLPVSASARQHLTRLLAIACVVRDPARFKVSLPALHASRRLAVAKVPRHTRMADVARRAAIDRGVLAQLNPGFRNGVVGGGAAREVLLPQHAAQRLARDDSWQVALARAPATSAGSAGAEPRHIVHRGESLWSIAHRHQVTVQQLQEWNELVDGKLQPGQVLLVGAPH